jgi:hypothetical protein
MKNVALLLIISGCFLMSSCKEKESERFGFLTDPIWVTDSLIANGVNAGGPGGILAKFLGDAKFEKDGTGYFGKYIGTWRFISNESQLVISSDSIPVIHSITTDIIELTSTSLKLKTSLPDPQDPTFQTLIKIRMTFKAK